MPTAHKEMEGTYREDRDGGTVRMRPGIPFKPTWLGEVASSVWDETISELERVENLLSDADGPALALYCDAWREYWEADAAVSEYGMVVSTLTGGLKPNPAVRMRATARADINRMAAKFCLTPSDRAATKLPTQTLADDDLDQLIA
jgi:P27 family predicted phage terminase small subunit